MELKSSQIQKLLDHPHLLDKLFEEDILDKKDFEKDIEYDNWMEKLQYEWIKLQNWVEKNQKRILIILEGRDAAGKGGAIKRILENLDPKIVKTIALSAPTDVEKTQWYFQRYIQHLPHGGEIIIFDRSWYNRAVVEPVFGFCTPEQHELFLQQVLPLEKMLVDDNIIFLKLFLSIDKEEQTERLEARKDDPMKEWKLGRLDQQAIEKWDDYTHYIQKMFNNTSSPYSPWAEINANSKRKTRLVVMNYILSHIDYEGKTSYDLYNDLVTVYK